MHDGIDPFDPGCVDGTLLGIPADLVPTVGRPSDDAPRTQTGLTESANERGSDEPARAGDRDVHADSMDAPSAPSSTG
jgi:hypothetical protein